MGLNELEKYGIAGVAVVIVIILLVSLGSGAPRGGPASAVGEEVPLPGLATDLQRQATVADAAGVKTPDNGESTGSRAEQDHREIAETVQVVRDDFDFGEWPKGREPVAHVVAAVDVKTEGPTGEAVGQGGNSKTYVVRPGDSLWIISKSKLGGGSRWRDLLAANPGLDPRRISPGMKLNLPGRRASAASGTGHASPRGAKPESASARSYKVRKGDSLEAIAKRFYGRRSYWRRIYEANRRVLRSPNRLAVGQTIELPAMSAQKPRVM